MYEMVDPMVPCTHELRLRGLRRTVERRSPSSAHRQQVLRLIDVRAREPHGERQT